MYPWAKVGCYTVHQRTGYHTQDMNRKPNALCYRYATRTGKQQRTGEEWEMEKGRE